MIKTPEFEKPKSFGALSDTLAVDIRAIKVTEGAEVILRYSGKIVDVRVTKIIAPQKIFEGVIDSFEGDELNHADLKHGDTVRFTYDQIEHIVKWIKKDQ